MNKLGPNLEENKSWSDDILRVEGSGLLGEAQVFAGKATANNDIISNKMPHEPVPSPIHHGLFSGLLIFEELVNEIVDKGKDMGPGFNQTRP